MRVLMINSVCGIRSTGRICTDLADVLTKQGHECRIAFGRMDVPSEYQCYAVRIGNDFDVNLHAVESRVLDNSGFVSRRATVKFLQWVKEYNPDVIHLHNLHGYYLNIELLFDYLKNSGKKIVWTLHDCWSFTGHCPHFDFIGCEKWLEGCFDCPLKREYPASYVCDNSKKNYMRKKNAFTGVPDMTIITPSRWLADIVRQSFLGSYPIQPIPNGVDLSVFRPTIGNFRELNRLEDTSILLGVASIWNKKKGLDDFIRLSELLNDSWKIVLVGLTNKQRRYLPERILGLTRTNNTRELAELYTTANVFVNPSVEETMGLTTVEALACGTPVIVYNRTATPEVVDMTCGIVLNENTPERIADVIEGVTFPKQSCIARASAYDRNTMYNEYLRAYHKTPV